MDEQCDAVFGAVGDQGVVDAPGTPRPLSRDSRSKLLPPQQILVGMPRCLTRLQQGPGLLVLLTDQEVAGPGRAPEAAQAVDLLGRVRSTAARAAWARWFRIVVKSLGGSPYSSSATVSRSTTPSTGTAMPLIGIFSCFDGAPLRPRCASPADSPPTPIAGATEGLVAERAHQRYQPGRRGWLKYPNRMNCISCNSSYTFASAVAADQIP
ncbi:hypothetical protein ACWY4P_01105 [Streptomyces sp. LZ34]